MALSELRDQVFFVARIAFEFELKVLTVVEFYDNIRFAYLYCFISFGCLGEIEGNKQKM